jgi:hypothetical protein
MENDDSNIEGPDVQPNDLRGPETRRRDFGGTPERACHRCDGPIKGRRTNGYCSDKCRLRDRRSREARRRSTLLNRLREVVNELEHELSANVDK